MQYRTNTPPEPDRRRERVEGSSARGPFRGPRLGRIAGIDVHADFSLLIIFTLVFFSLATGVLPRWHPEWGTLLVWGVGFAASVLFFVSVLLHELSHALVGRAFGIPVRRITLFVFGGVAHLEEEPSSPKAELVMAIVGPITSLAIAFVATVGGMALAGPQVAHADDAVAAAQHVGPLATLLLWLGPVNFMLGAFNLVPGFPLDGGRVLRAAIWWATGDILEATRWAAAAGRAVGFALMFAGVVMALGVTLPFFGTGLGSGLWLLLIGWFLQNAARAAYEQLVVREHLAGVPVTRVMRSRLRTVSPDLTIAALVGDYVMDSDQGSFPVVADDQLLGIVSGRHVRAVPSEKWPAVTVREVMTPAAAIPAIDVTAGANEALDKLVRSEVDPLPVLDHGHLRGFVRRQDILTWLSLQPRLHVQ